MPIFRVTTEPFANNTPLGTFTFTRTSPPIGDALYKRGDTNQDTLVDISDGVFILLGLFGGGDEQFRCEKSIDSNNDGDVDLSGAVFLLSYLLNSGDTPEAPFAECGSAPTPDDLTCASYAPCA